LVCESDPYGQVNDNEYNPKIRSVSLRRTILNVNNTACFNRSWYLTAAFLEESFLK